MEEKRRIASGPLATKEWEKLRDDTTCPGKRSSFASLGWDFGLFKSFTVRIRTLAFYPRCASLSRVCSSATTIVSVGRHDSAGCAQNVKGNPENYLLNSTLLHASPGYFVFRVKNVYLLARSFLSAFIGNDVQHES